MCCRQSLTSSHLSCGRHGHGVYKHPTPSVHGLWPETGKYGNSVCMRPKDARGPKNMRSPRIHCFPDLKLAKHEWEVHGKCAGSKNALDYFEQICDLAEEPLRMMKEVMASTRVHRVKGLKGMERELSHTGMHVWYVDTHESQLYLSACADKDGRWQLAPPGPTDEPEFDAVCAL